MRLVKRLRKIFEAKQPVIWLILTLAAFQSVMAMSEPLPTSSTPVPILVEPTVEELIITLTPGVVESPTTAVFDSARVTFTGSPTSEPIALTPTNTPFPPEYATNREQTNGIILATIFLLLIVIIGTYIGIRRLGKEE